MRQTKGEVQFANLPNPTYLTGDFSSVATAIVDPLTGQPFPGNRVPQSRITPFAALQLSAIPAPNTTGANNYRAVRDFTDNTDTWTARVDHDVLNGAHTSFARVHLVRQPAVAAQRDTDTGQPQTGKNLAVGHTWVISPGTVNETRVGYNFSFHGQEARLAGEDFSRNWVADVGLHNLYGSANPDYYGRPGATIAGFAGVAATGVGANATDWIYSVSNATSKVAGPHTLRFGFQSEWRKTDQDTTTGARGGFTFNGRATGAANNPANAVADFLLGTARRARARSGARARPTSPPRSRRSSTTCGGSTTR